MTKDAPVQQLEEEEYNDQYLSFHLDQEEYGIELLMVQEILRDFKPSKIPNAEQDVQGMINFRGRIIPLIDVRSMLGLPPRDDGSITVTIVLEFNGKNIGLIVDRVYDIVSLPAANIQSIDEHSASELQAKHLKGLARIDERLILLLDLEKVITFY